MRAALLLALLSTAALGGAPSPDGGAKPKAIVAVLYFDVDDGYRELHAFRKGFAELLITDLVQANRWKIVERARMEEVLAELKLQDSKNFDASTARQVGKMLLARYQVMGSLLRTKQGLLVQARLIDVEKNEVIKASRAVAQDDDVLAAEQQVFNDLQQRLAEAEAEQQAVTPRKATYKVKYQTAVKYAEALDAKDHHDTKTAVTRLTEVVRENPDFVLAKLDLATLTK